MLQTGSLIALGALFLGGLVADLVARKTGFPRATLLLAIGLVTGAAGLDLIPSQVQTWYATLSIVALTMVAFLMGGTLHRDSLRRNGRAIFAVSLAIAGGTVLIVTIGLMAVGLPFGLAILLGAIAAATDPAATADVIRQSGVDNSFTRTVQGIVAIDDLWGLIIFSIVLIIVGWATGVTQTAGVTTAMWEVAGALLLGLAIGVPAALLTGRLADGEPLEIEALSIVFLTAGLSLWLQVSFLITGMVVGATVANLAAHHTKTFQELEHIQWPFMVLFFVLAGSTLDVGVATTLGAVGIGFVVLRSLGRFVGGWIGAHLGGVPRKQRPWFGIALLPQAGVAIGMALIAAHEFPQWSAQIIALTISATVVFEIIGPVLTAVAVRRTRN